MKTERVSFMSQGQRISGVLHLPSKDGLPCVIASHGLLSSKDSEKYISLGEGLSHKGIAMLRFDFRGIGESEGRMDDDSISRRLTDLDSAISFVKSYMGVGSEIGLVGSSLGGYISLIMASMDKEIKATVVWATPFHLNNLSSGRESEEYHYPGDVFLMDLKRHPLMPVLHKVSNCLIIHGERDELVPLDHALNIFSHLNLPKEIHIIGGADHRLTDSNHRKNAIELTVDWFKKFLT